MRAGVLQPAQRDGKEAPPSGLGADPSELTPPPGIVCPGDDRNSGGTGIIQYFLLFIDLHNNKMIFKFSIFLLFSSVFASIALICAIRNFNI